MDNKNKFNIGDNVLIWDNKESDMPKKPVRTTVKEVVTDTTCEWEHVFEYTFALDDKVYTSTSDKPFVFYRHKAWVQEVPI